MQSAGAGNLRLARQGKRDARLSLAFDDQFKPRFNTGGGRNAADVNAAPIFVSHTSGKLGERQRCAINVAFYLMTQRRCCCAGYRSFVDLPVSACDLWRRRHYRRSS